MARHPLSVTKLLIVFIVVFSFGSLSGGLSGQLHLPALKLVNALPAPCNTHGSSGSCSEFWYPSGPAMDTLQTPIFTDSIAELSNLQSASPSIDLTDSPLPPSLISPLSSSPNFYVTSAVSAHSYDDIEFLLPNNFWGVNMNFGNATAGVEIRQGISHMIDKNVFVSNDAPIAGLATALDNPVPPSNGGLNTPNPCQWDASFPQSGSNCIVGSPGGTAYHLGSAAGADGYPWLQAPGSADLNAAAQHFVIAGIATGFNSTTSVLTGISSAAAAHSVNFFIRNDDPPRLDLGNSMAAQICYLFTGSYVTPCPPYLTVTRGPITNFCVFADCCISTSICLNWGIYTGAYSDVFPFDASLYYTFNSRFVNGISSIKISGGGLCSNSSVPTVNPPDSIYLCDPTYDGITSQMEFASSLSSAVGFGEQAEDRFGSHAYTIPIFSRTDSFAYLNNWQRVVNDDGAGIPNSFTWLDAYSPNPAVSGTIRQGFSQTTLTVSPYAASTSHDFYLVRSIYDALMIENPLSHGQVMSWMAMENSIPLSGLTYTPPPGTVSSFRFTLRPDVFFQDGRKVTAFDVAFSYLSLEGTGAMLGAGATSMTGLTILGPSQFDINVNGIGPFTLNHLASLPILPGGYWSNAGSSAWNGAIAKCTATNAPCYPAQYTINSSTSTTTNCALTCTFPAADMNVNVAQTSASYDPIANHTLVGSGPFTCGVVTSAGSSTSCSSSGTMNPPVAGGSYTLSRFGKGLSPGSSISSIYFRSGTDMGLWTWTEDNGDITNDFLVFATLASCFGALQVRCVHWMEGIGGCGGTDNSLCAISLTQISIVNRYVGMNWTGPFNWQSSPPLGITPFAPVIYDSGFTWNPASLVGCFFAFPTGGYDC